MAYCDEFHFGLGTLVTKRMKRKRGKVYRTRPYNVHKKKVTSKDTKAKAREENYLKLFNVFVVISYNYKRVITYEVLNNISKINTKEYISYVLPILKADPNFQGLTLCQDADSAYSSKETIK